MLFDSYGKFIFYDGAMGTMLQNAGLKPGQRPDIMNMTMADTVEKIHSMYLEAGSDIICTNTFGSNALNLERTGYSPEDVITAAVSIAKRAVARHASSVPALVALDLGPTGRILEPTGELDPERAYELFKEMAVAGEKAGADLVAIETMSDIEELKTAMSAVKENTSLPILATMTFEKSGRTFMGCTAGSFVEAAELLGAAAVGINCSLEPVQMLDTAKQIAKAAKLPLIVKPNAGLPDRVSGKYHYHTGAEDFAAQMLPFAEIGARIVGGCCGTTPDYIRALREAFLKL